jgi:superfamily I DNA/RNA helicase
MRCPKVVVDAVNDVIKHAQQLHKLNGRIPKLFKYFPPVKGTDSAKYPQIALVETTVQRQEANYMGRYIEQAIRNIPPDEIKEAVEKGYPAALVIVSKPYRDQIISHLESVGITIDTKRDSVDKIDRELGLSILKKDQDSNLGWRIVLNVDKPSFLADIVAQTADGVKRLWDVLPDEFRNSVLADVAAYGPLDEESLDNQPTMDPAGPLPVKVTSFEGAKGLSAQHVFIAGLHDNELPHNPNSVQDLEICKFVVGLTRTRKMCSLIYTCHFASAWKSRSSFISWIDSSRLEHVKVDAAYWKK